MAEDFFVAGHITVRGKAVTRALAANGTIAIPAGAIITRIFFRNKTANAVTGGIRIGTVTTGVDILAAGAVAASAFVTYLPLIGNYQAAAVSLFVEAVTAWNSAVVDVCVEYVLVT